VIQNRSFEAGGLDAIAFGVDEARKLGDHELAEFYEAQLADEISHVRFANEWIRKSLKEDPRTLLRMGVSLNAAAQAFRMVMGAEGTEGADYPAAVQARLDAGFTPEEVKTAAQLQAGQARPAASGPAMG
jgi:uncharacterized ferritin-like protein (DUF455 family)